MVRDYSEAGLFAFIKNTIDIHLGDYYDTHPDDSGKNRLRRFKGDKKLFFNSSSENQKNIFTEKLQEASEDYKFSQKMLPIIEELLKKKSLSEQHQHACSLFEKGTLSLLEFRLVLRGISANMLAYWKGLHQTKIASFASLSNGLVNANSVPVKGADGNFMLIRDDFFDAQSDPYQEIPYYVHNNQVVCRLPDGSECVLPVDVQRIGSMGMHTYFFKHGEYFYVVVSRQSNGAGATMLVFDAKNTALPLASVTVNDKTINKIEPLKIVEDLDRKPWLFISGSDVLGSTHCGLLPLDASYSRDVQYWTDISSIPLVDDDKNSIGSVLGKEKLKNANCHDDVLVPEDLDHKGMFHESFRLIFDFAQKQWRAQPFLIAKGANIFIEQTGYDKKKKTSSYRLSTSKDFANPISIEDVAPINWDGRCVSVEKKTSRKLFSKSADSDYHYYDKDLKEVLSSKKSHFLKIFPEYDRYIVENASANTVSVLSLQNKEVLFTIPGTWCTPVLGPYFRVRSGNSSRIFSLFDAKFDAKFVEQKLEDTLKTYAEPVDLPMHTGYVHEKLLYSKNKKALEGSSAQYLLDQKGRSDIELLCRDVSGLFQKTDAQGLQNCLSRNVRFLKHKPTDKTLVLMLFWEKELWQDLKDSEVEELYDDLTLKGSLSKKDMFKKMQALQKALPSLIPSSSESRQTYIHILKRLSVLYDKNRDYFNDKSVLLQKPFSKIQQSFIDFSYAAALLHPTYQEDDRLRSLKDLLPTFEIFSSLEEYQQIFKPLTADPLPFASIPMLGKRDRLMDALKQEPPQQEAVWLEMNMKRFQNGSSDRVDAEISGIIEGQTQESYLFLRELLQNIRDEGKKEKQVPAEAQVSCSVRQREGSKDFVISVEDSLGIDSLQRLIQYLLTYDNSDKSRAGDQEQAVLGMFGKGFYTVFAAADEVHIRTGKNGKEYRFGIGIKKEGSQYRLTLLYSDVTSKSQLKGTRIDVIKTNTNDDDIAMEMGFLSQNLQRYGSGFHSKDLKITVPQMFYFSQDKTKIVEHAVVGPHDEALGEVSLWQRGLGEPIITVGGSYLASLKDPFGLWCLRYFSKEWQRLFLNTGGLQIDLPATIPLTSARHSVLESYCECISRSITLALLKMTVKDYFEKGANPPGLPLDILLVAKMDPSLYEKIIRQVERFGEAKDYPTNQKLWDFLDNTKEDFDIILFWLKVNVPHNGEDISVLKFIEKISENDSGWIAGKKGWIHSSRAADIDRAVAKSSNIPPEDKREDTTLKILAGTGSKEKLASQFLAYVNVFFQPLFAKHFPGKQMSWGFYHVPEPYTEDRFVWYEKLPDKGYKMLIQDKFILENKGATIKKILELFSQCVHKDKADSHIINEFYFYFLETFVHEFAHAIEGDVLFSHTQDVEGSFEELMRDVYRELLAAPARHYKTLLAANVLSAMHEWWVVVSDTAFPNRGRELDIRRQA